MKKPRKDESFLKQPYYEGGDAALKKFIAENIKYPESALAHGIEGSIPLTMEINYQGEVTDVKTMGSLGHGCEEEAIRLVKMLKFTVPKIPRHVKVVFHKKLTIHFTLPKTNQAITQTLSYQIQYTKPALVPKPAPESKPIYTYTIKING